MERPAVMLHELQTVYGLQDLYDLIEIGAVDAHNRRLSARREEDRLKQLDGG